MSELKFRIWRGDSTGGSFRQPLASLNSEIPAANAIKVLPRRMLATSEIKPAVSRSAQK